MTRNAGREFGASRCVVIALALLVSACGGDEAESYLPPPDEAAVASAEAAVTNKTNNPSIEIVETVNGADFGLIGDGASINTEAFERLFSRGNRRIRIARGDYVTGPILIPKNTILELEPGTIIRDSGALVDSERLINIKSDNVHIIGYGARVLANRADYSSGEQRHGVYIFGAHNVVIEGLESSGHGGDGFYIGGVTGDPSTDITLSGCRAENNRRQGLSITSARRVRVADCELALTNGTDPEFGIDLEPNRATDALHEIVLLRPQTLSNRGGGIMIQLHKLDATSEPVDITIIDHYSTGERQSLHMVGTEGVPSIIRYNRAN